MIWGEWLEAINWQLQKVSVRRAEICRCQVGCICMSSSSTSTTATPSRTGSSRPGFACDRRRARSRASVSIPRSPSDRKRTSSSVSPLVISRRGLSSSPIARRPLHVGRNRATADFSASRCILARGNSPASASCAKIQEAMSARYRARTSESASA